MAEGGCEQAPNRPALHHWQVPASPEQELIQHFLNPGKGEDRHRQQGLALEAIEAAEAAWIKGVLPYLVHSMAKAVAILARFRQDAAGQRIA